MGRAFEYRKAKKFKRWGMMAKTFTKIGREISMAVKSGGPSPDANARLRAAIQNAKAASMPKENVERAIKKASNKDEENYKEVVYEGYGPHGVAVLIETATDNTNRTVANVRSYFNKTGGSLGTSGCLDFVFERKCVFKIHQMDFDPEELELELIDFGAEEVFVEYDEELNQKQIIIYGAFEAFGGIQKALEENKAEIISSGFERMPLVNKEGLTDEQVADVEKLLEKLEEDDDVLNVFNNMI